MRNIIYSFFAVSLLLSTSPLFSQAVPAPANDTVTPPTTQEMDAKADDSLMKNDLKQTTVAPVQAIGDEQITGILLTVNDGEIKAADLAQKRGQGREVKEFAKQMIDDHGAANREVKAFASKLRIKPASSEIKANLEASAKAGEKRLQALKGREFDKVYLDEQVMMHQTVLDTIDQHLVPNAKAPDIKAHLAKVRPTVAKHLDHARSLQSAQTVGGR